MKGFFKFLVIFALVLVGGYFLFRSCGNGPASVFTPQGEFSQKESLLSIPIDMDISSFEPIFNKQMEDPEWFYEEENVEVNNQVKLSYRIKKDGQAQLYPQDGSIQLKLPLYLEIYPKVKGPLGIGLGKNMRLESRFEMSSIIDVNLNDDWGLDTKANTTFEIKSSPKLNLAGFEIDFESQLVNSLQLGVGEINKIIETQVESAIDTRAIVELVWNMIKTPYEIDADPFQAWAMIVPEKVNASNLKPSGPGMMQIAFEVPAMIDIETGSRPARVNSKKLPKPDRVEEIPDQFSVFRIPLFIPLESLSEALNKSENGFSVNIAAGQKVKFSNFYFENKNNQLLIKTTFETVGAKGDVELLTTPEYNPELQEFGMVVTKINSKSNNKVVDRLIESYGNSNTGKQQLQRALSYNLKKDLDKLNGQMTEQLQKTKFNEYASLTGHVDYIKVLGVHLDNDRVILDTEIQAKLKCAVQAIPEAAKIEN